MRWLYLISMCSALRGPSHSWTATDMFFKPHPDTVAPDHRAFEVSWLNFGMYHAYSNDVSTITQGSHLCGVYSWVVSVLELEHHPNFAGQYLQYFEELKSCNRITTSYLRMIWGWGPNVFAAFYQFLHNIMQVLQTTLFGRKNLNLSSYRWVQISSSCHMSWQRSWHSFQCTEKLFPVAKYSDTHSDSQHVSLTTFKCWGRPSRIPGLTSGY